MDMNKALKDMIADAVKDKDMVIQEQKGQLQEKEGQLLAKDSEIRLLHEQTLQLHEQTLQRARKMLSDGLTHPQIIDYTGLTEQEIQNLTN